MKRKRERVKKKGASEKAAKRGAASAINPLPAREGKTTPKSNEDTYIAERAPSFCATLYIYVYICNKIYIVTYIYTYLHTQTKRGIKRERGAIK